MSTEVTAAAERILMLVKYSKETGVRTSYVQQKLLREFNAEEQEQIIRIVTSPLSSGDPEAGLQKDGAQ